MAVFWMLLGLTVSIWSATFPFGDWKSPGPALFPMGTGLLIILFGIIILFQAWKPKEGGSSTPYFIFLHRAGAKRVVYCLVGMVAAGAAFDYVGFVITIFLMILFMMLTIDRQPLKKALFYSVISALGAFLIFKVILKTTLPGGFLGI